MVVPTLTLNAPISQFFTDSFVDTQFLTPNERAIIVNSAAKRQRDFATGRLCAKKALQHFSLADAEILRAKGMEPIWPDGFVGSISHADGLCGAVAARANDITAIGLDIEKIGGVKKDMWYMICTPGEQDMLNAMPADEQVVYATLLFSIKESFYKLQSPLTGHFLEFTDVELQWEDDNFNLKVLKSGYKITANLDRMAIQWAKHAGYVISICYIPN